MASTEFQLVNNQTFLPADIVQDGDGNDNIFISAEQTNGSGINFSTGLQIIVDYHDLQSVPSGTILKAVVEGKSLQGQFYTIAHQFSSFGTVGTQQRQQIIVSQDSLVFPPFVDSVISVSGVTIEQISRQQGIIPKTWRVRVAIRDDNSAFVSVRMSIYGQRFNQLTLPEDFRGILVDTDTKGTLVTTRII